MMIITYCRSNNIIKQADLLLENIESVKQFLKKENWTKADMNCQKKWVNTYGFHRLGNITDYNNGVKIMKYENSVHIVQFAKFVKGDAMGPNIYCTDGTFEIL
jgi:hypothetical protein